MKELNKGTTVELKRDTMNVKAGTLGLITKLVPNALDTEGYVCVLWNANTSAAASEWLTRPVADELLKVLLA